MPEKRRNADPILIGQLVAGLSAASAPRKEGKAESASLSTNNQEARQAGHSSSAAELNGFILLAES
jgi:hypothetical protein